MFQTTVVIYLKHVSCAACGIVFGVSQDYEQRRRNDHSNFYCPNGHINYYPQKSKEEILKDQLTRAHADADQIKAQLGDTRRSLIAQKAQTTRIKNRILNGVCPCCNRHFKNIHQHMQTKHPEYK